MPRALVPRASRAICVALLSICASAWPGRAWGQTADGGRVDVGGGIGWSGRIGYSEVDSRQRSTAGDRRVFTTHSTLESLPAVVGRVGVRLFSALAAEGAVTYGTTRLTTRVTGDVEGVPDISVSEPVKQFVIEGGLRAALRNWRTSRMTPFVSAGAGYVRQLNDGQTLVETGRSYYAGGGAHFFLTGGGARKGAAGIRGDVRATFVRDGVALDRATHVVPFVGVSLFVRF